MKKDIPITLLYKLFGKNVKTLLSTTPKPKPKKLKK